MQVNITAVLRLIPVLLIPFGSSYYVVKENI